MNFENDFARLDRTARVLHWVRWGCGALAVVALATAATAWPGSWGQALAFHDIQIHLDLINHFDKLGVETTRYDNQVIWGLRFEQIHALIQLISIAPALIAIGGVFRGQWRRVLGYGALWYVMTSLPNLVENKHGFEVAIPAEFGVRPPEVLFALPKVDPTFSKVQDQLKTPNAQNTQAEAYDAKQPEDRRRRAEKIRKELDGNMSEFTPAQAAAMHYTAAQVAYLEQDLGSTRRHLNLISAQTFHPTEDSDYRLRRMREWVEAHGGGLLDSTYAPITGWPLSFTRLVAKLCFGLGLLATFGYVVVARAALILAKRFVRLHRLEERLCEKTPLPWVAAASSGFGKRATTFSNRVQTPSG